MGIRHLKGFIEITGKSKPHMNKQELDNLIKEHNISCNDLIGDLYGYYHVDVEPITFKTIKSNAMKTFDLAPINGRKSFNGKAKVIQENGVSKLFSFTTIVAEYNHEQNKITINGWYSNTTLIHINAFLDFYGFDTCTKKQLIDRYSLTK